MNVQNRTMNADQLKNWLKTGNHAVAEGSIPYLKEGTKLGIKYGVPVAVAITAAVAAPECPPVGAALLGAAVLVAPACCESSAEPVSNALVDGSSMVYIPASDCSIDCSVDLVSSIWNRFN